MNNNIKNQQLFKKEKILCPHQKHQLFAQIAIQQM